MHYALHLHVHVHCVHVQNTIYDVHVHVHILYLGSEIGHAIFEMRQIWTISISSG